MRRFFILFLLILFSSLSISAKRIQDFEYGEWGDSTWGWKESRFFVNNNDMKFVTDKAYSGSQSIMLPLIDTIPFGGIRMWLLYCKSAYWTNGICKDSVFMHENVEIGDSIFYYLYCSPSAPIDSIVLYVRDSDWRNSIYDIYQYDNLTMDAWNELICYITDTNVEGLPMRLPLLQFDFWFWTDMGVYPFVCTLYIDAISTDGPVSGITINPDKINLETSINNINFILDEPAHVLLSIYNLTGIKVTEIVPGRLTAGAHSIPVENLPTGIYIVRGVFGQVKLTGKLLII